MKVEQIVLFSLWVHSKMIFLVDKAFYLTKIRQIEVIWLRKTWKTHRIPSMSFWPSKRDRCYMPRPRQFYHKYPVTNLDACCYQSLIVAAFDFRGFLDKIVKIRSTIHKKTPPQIYFERSHRHFVYWLVYYITVIP